MSVSGSNFYGSGSNPRRRQKTAAGRLLAGRLLAEAQSPHQYGPGMYLSDFPCFDASRQVAEASDSDDYHEELAGNQGVPRSTPTFTCGELGHPSTSSSPSDSAIAITPRRPCQVTGQSASADMVVLFQKQQTLLQKVLATQESMVKKQEDLETKFISLEKKCHETCEPTHTSTRKGKRKRTVSLSLSVSHCMLAML